ncbi:MAG: helix-turn-helix domain-containing protein [Patescibacteria group bacterium]
MQLENRFYTSTEVAQILGVSLRSVYRYLEEGKLKADVKTATNRHRFTRQNILDFLYPQGYDPRLLEAPAIDISSAPVPIATSLPGNYMHSPYGMHPNYSNQSMNPQMYQPYGGHMYPYQQYPMNTPQQNMVNPNMSHGYMPSTLPNDSIGSATPPAPSSNIAPTVDIPAVPVSTPTEVVPEPVVEQPTNEIDWLAKFKEASAKYQSEKVPESLPSAETPVDIPIATAAVPPVVSEAVVQEEPEHTESTYYYRSGVGGLKDIAQTLDKVSKKSDIPYAFTLSAGLSLHKPIKPFSLLHAYVRRADLSLFETSLQLTPNDPESAQLCLLVADGTDALSTKHELHGLSVVSNTRLKHDLINSGETELAKEM